MQQSAEPISKSYYKCRISANELRALVARDERAAERDIRASRERAIYKVWPDFPVYALIDRSTITVKSDAAISAYDATGDQIVWAVIDSGISGNHIHFGSGKGRQGEEHVLQYAL